jgi:hypothetical protein
LSSDSSSQSQNLCRHSPVAVPELSPELKTLPSLGFGIVPVEVTLGVTSTETAN